MARASTFDGSSANWLLRIREAIADAMRVRREVSAIMRAAQLRD